MLWFCHLGQALNIDKYWKNSGLTYKYKIVLKQIIHISKFVIIFQTQNIKIFVNYVLKIANDYN